MKLSEKEIKRYNRQIIAMEIGEEGQEKLKSSSILIMGLGGLGSPVAYYLTAAGVGRLGLIDMDVVELSNLQRQIIHSTETIGKNKTDSAFQKLSRLNPNVKLKLINEKLTTKNALSIIENYDFIVDCSDNFGAKFLVNDACLKKKKPFSIGGVRGFEGQLMTVIPFKSACYRCVFHSPPPKTDSPLPVVGATPGFAGTIQAMEAIKYIIGLRDGLLTNFLLIFDLLTMSFQKIRIKADENCPACGKEPSDLLNTYQY
ncbi:MAG: HesA/MoeB/ThiF family protein [Candidatus Helarchaeota archaeon]|nr:HesA/MoeB/ThiF family protein [Candidatus Helarchaeota archaeon]